MSNEPGMSKRQALREKRVREQQRNRLVSMGGIAVAVLALFFFIIWPLIKPDFIPHEHAQVNDNSMGDENAPITVTEYSDFQCPYCRRFWEETEEQLVQTYVATGKVRLIYRSFGGFIGPESQASAEAAYCAGEQGQFWDYHDIIFTNQNGENTGAFSSVKLDSFAKAIGLDMTTFNSCVDNNKFASRVLQDGMDGVNAGIQATPTFIITYVVNGETKTRQIQGAEPFTTFQSEINAALAEMGLQ